MINKRIQAFTILEVTITMLIASVLIGFTYMAYSIVIKSYGSFNQKNQDMAVLVRLDEWLKKDFAHAEIIQKDTAGIVLNSAGHQIKYQFDPDFIVRAEFRTDTFKVKTATVTTSFEDQPVNDLSTTEDIQKPRAQTTGWHPPCCSPVHSCNR